MSLRSYVVRKSLGEDPIKEIYGHGFATYLPYLVTRGSAIIALIRGTRAIRTMINSSVLDILFLILGIGLYVISMIRFLDIYLDVIVLSENGLNIFKRDGLFHNQIQSIEWESIQSVEDSQEGLIDTITSSGDLKIIFQYGKIIFHDIHTPSIVRIAINTIKEQMIAEANEENKNEKFDMLVETLGEVISSHYNSTHEKK